MAVVVVVLGFGCECFRFVCLLDDDEFFDFDDLSSSL